MEKIYYEVEKDIDKNGGVYFDTLQQAEQYAQKQIMFCREQLE